MMMMMKLIPQKLLSLLRMVAAYCNVVTAVLPPWLRIYMFC